MTVTTSWTDPSSGGALDLTDGDIPTAAGYFDLLASDLLSLGGTKGLLPVCQGRLTLTTAVPVTTENVTNATTIYFTPFRGDRIALFDGTLWKTLTFAEISLAVGTLTANLPYDVFAYDNSGTVTLEFLAWTSGTARATALVLQNGVLCKTGALTRRYLGTFMPSTTTQVQNTTSQRHIWNYYNRVPMFLSCVDTTTSWTYTTHTWRASNGNTTDGVGRFSCVIGWAEDACDIMAMSIVRNSTGFYVASGIGIDSTSADSSILHGMTASGTDSQVASHYKGVLPVGYHYIQWLEISGANGTTTWEGTEGNAAANDQSGMIGVIYG